MSILARDRGPGSAGVATILSFAFCCVPWPSPAAAEQHELCFYVERPCTILGVPVGAGHAFLELHDLKGTFGGASFFRGFYPAGANIFGGAGTIKNDATRPWHYKRRGWPAWRFRSR